MPLTRASSPKILSLVETNNDIYIRADGSVDPDTAPIQCFGNLYVFIDSIYNRSIVVERNNIVIDGSNYSLQCTGFGCGFNLTNVNNVTIENTYIEGFSYGIYESHTYANGIFSNNITNNYDGIYLYFSDHCKVSENDVDDSKNCGIFLLGSNNCAIERSNANNNRFEGIKLEDYSNNNTVSNNKAINNMYGIYLFSSYYCQVSGNNASENKFGIQLTYSSYCSVSGNNSTNNEYNIRLDNSSENTLKSNNMTRNAPAHPCYNFGVSGLSLQEYIHNIDTSNTVNGKPLYYLINQHNLTIDSFTYATVGYLALVNSTGITVEGLSISNNRQGLLFAYTTYSRIYHFTAINNKEGISLYHCLNCILSSNEAIYNMYYGIILTDSSNCCLSDNELTYNTDGIYISYSLDCLITGNNLIHNECGIRLEHSSNNRISHNNFIDNTQQACTQDAVANSWDNAYPEGGNYWNDYNCIDLFSGPYQNESGSDGLGDIPYAIDEDNKDNYPLTGTFYAYDVIWNKTTFQISIISNSTVSDFEFEDGYNGSQRVISYTAKGKDDTIGFCRVTVPTDLLNYPYIVRVNGGIVNATILRCSNTTHACIYFTYNHNTNHVEIVPEFQLSFLLTLLVVVATMAIVFTCMRKKSNAINTSENEGNDYQKKHPCKH